MSGGDEGFTVERVEKHSRRAWINSGLDSITAARRLLHGVPPPGLLPGGSRREVLLNLLLNLSLGWQLCSVPSPGPKDRNEMTQEFAVKLLKYALLCFNGARRGTVRHARLPAGHRGLPVLLPRASAQLGIPLFAGDARLRS